MNHVAHLAIRQAGVDPTTPSCSADNEYNGEIGARISAIFVILVGSVFGKTNGFFILPCFHLLIADFITGAVFPVFAQKHKGTKVPECAFFIAKYFGSGVIIATAFIHVCTSIYASSTVSNSW